MKLEKFILEHENWKELLADSPYCITIKQKDNKYIFNYNQILSDMSLSLVQECRGVILEINQNEVRRICVPFFKFFNAEEPNSHLPHIDWSTASVQEKVDGSLIKVFYDFSQSKWTVATNATIDAKDATANDYFDFRTFFNIAFSKGTSMTLEEYGEKCLTKGYTYMFELVSPHTRIVVPYPTIKLYFLGLRDNDSLLEHKPSECELAKHFDVPQTFPLSTYAQVREAAAALPWDKEGYVVCDVNFNRVKIKSPAYVVAHHNRNNGTITRKRLLDIIYNGDEDDFLVYADQIWKKELIRLKSFVQADLEDAAAYYRIYSSIVDQKEFAATISKLPPHIQSILFCMRKKQKPILKMTDFTIEFWRKAIKEK